MKPGCGFLVLRRFQSKDWRCISSRSLSGKPTRNKAGEACQKTSWQGHAYCLIRNHYHLGVETKSGPFEVHLACGFPLDGKLLIDNQYTAMYYTA